MVSPKKTATDLANGPSKKDIPNMAYQKKDTMAGKSQNGAFRTDSAISSGRLGGERVLQRWQPDKSDTFDGSLEKSGSTGNWDQFSANEKLFGLKTDYDENIYTTQIDKNHPQYRERAAAAERKAREIERSVASTSHVAEERTMDYSGSGNDRGEDEEDKYSGVKRQDFPPLPGGNRDNKYTPPARRAPTGSSTVKGAPIDPAIIASQLKTQKNQSAPKVEDSEAHTTPVNETAPVPVATPTSKTPEPRAETKSEVTQKPTDAKSASQTLTPQRPSAATSRTISPQAKEGTVAPSATSTVERDVLKEFKSFANQQRMNAEKVRSTKAKADKEVKLIELKKFAESFKLPTRVPVDLIGIIAKDPAKQKEIQQKAERDAAELARRKAEEKVAQEKKPVATKDGQTGPANTQAGVQTDRARPTGTSTAAQPPPTAAARHPGGRGNFVPQPQYSQFRNDRAGGAQHAGPAGRQTQGLAARIRNAENQKMGDMRQPPTGPANAVDPSFARRMGMPNHMSNKLNPNSHEFRPSPFAAAFSPNGHPSGGSSPRSAMNHTTEAPSIHSTSNAAPTVITKKRKAIDTKKCSILAHVKTLPKPEGKNWADNDGIKPSFDTPPTWRQAQDDEKPESTMRLSYTEYFERQPFAAQPTPNPTHAMPQLAHQHQLPFHLQHGAHNGPRQSPHVPPVQMHPGQHGPMPHAPFNGADDHRMMHSNSSQSFSSPRMGPVPISYPPNMNSPAQMPYGQNGMPFMPGTPQQMGNHFNRSFSNNPQYMPQQQVPMGTPMMMQPHFVSHQGMPGQMQMYPGGPQFMPPGGAPPQQMPGANGYPSPGRPAAPMMVHQGSQQGQPIYGMSPGMQFQQPVFPQQPGQMNNMRGYSNPGSQQYGTSPQQVHQYPQQHRNGSNYKNYQGHSQHQGPQGGHQVPSGLQGRTPEGTDETK
ncbi:LsmAD domain-containing protein [Xylariales sp. AK1849]|nr:LsmAD domain-containing protein [Xylariales sp. AK1849]